MKKRYFVTVMLIFALIGSAFAQERTITGKITSAENGLGLPGVTVMVKGTSIGVITNADGQYSITVPSDAETLVFTFVGMEDQEFAIGNSTTINAEMVPDLLELEQVVVTAFGIERQTKALGFSAQVLEAENLTASREDNLASYLTGKVAGVQVSSTSSGTGGSSVVAIRGNNSLSGSNQPLYVVDGVPITNRGIGSGSGM